MRSLMLGVVSIATLCATPALAQVVATAGTTVTATFAARTSLQVSTHLLEFEVTDPSREAVVEVAFTAAARTRRGSEVLLIVEPLHSIDGPGGAADVDTLLTVSGDSAGVARMGLRPHESTVTSRWIGSGVRSARLVFSLRAAAPGRYRVPIGFQLSAP